MNFGERIKRQEMVEEFLDLCDEMNLSLSQRRGKIQEVEKNIDEYEHYDKHTVNVIRDRLDNYESCPNCDSDFLYDEENEEGYCPVCES